MADALAGFRLESARCRPDLRTPEKQGVGFKPFQPYPIHQPMENV